MASRRKFKIQRVWEPPRLGEFSFLMDAAFADLQAFLGMLLRNHSGQFMGAWTSHYPSPTVFCAEMSVVIQALNKADELKLEKVVFESDSLGVILALLGLHDYEEWQARALLTEGKRLLSKHPL